MGPAGLTNHPLLIMPVGRVTRSSVATLSRCGIGARESRSLSDPRIKTGKADEVKDKKRGNEFTIYIFKGKDKNDFLHIVQHLK